MKVTRYLLIYCINFQHSSFFKWNTAHIYNWISKIPKSMRIYLYAFFWYQTCCLIWGFQNKLMLYEPNGNCNISRSIIRKRCKKVDLFHLIRVHCPKTMLFIRIHLRKLTSFVSISVAVSSAGFGLVSQYYPGYDWSFS